MNDKVIKLPSIGRCNIVESMVDADKSILAAIMAVDHARRAGNHNNSLPVVNVPIPETVLMPCPLTTPHFRRATACKECVHFGGVVQKAWSDTHPIPWSQKFAIRCQSPIERNCAQAVVET